MAIGDCGWNPSKLAGLIATFDAGRQRVTRIGATLAANSSLIAMLTGPCCTGGGTADSSVSARGPHEPLEHVHERLGNLLDDVLVHVGMVVRNGLLNRLDHELRHVVYEALLPRTPGQVATR